MPAPTRTVHFYGHVMQIVFETSTDLTQFMPEGLTPVDPHRAFIKAERLKMRSPETMQNPAGFTHYQQICITTMAAPPTMGPRHRNILMWEDRPWGIGGSLVAVKRYGGVDMTQLYEQDRKLIEQGEVVPFFIDINNGGFSLLHFAGELDGRKRVDPPPFNGFFVGGEPGSELRALTLDTGDLERHVHGHGVLTFGHAPNEQMTLPGWGTNWPATLLKDVNVLGCVASDLSFTRTYGADFAPALAAAAR